MKIKTVYVQILAIFSLVFSFGQNSYASVPATGEFTATKECQAYQSMRRKTNPGDMLLEIGQSYVILERNVPSSATWYRLRVEEANPPERWVYFECGIIGTTIDGQSQQTTGERGDASNNQCFTAGLKDSFVFALSWQPAFCEGRPQKPECKVSDPFVYQARNFTLHGLWPNKQSCGKNYGFCGIYKESVNPFCNYDPVPMQARTLEKLGLVMPSAAHGSCLQRHEWYKHGTCQTERNADEYFDTAMRLLEEFNSSGMAKFMQENIGQTVTTQTFFDAVDQAFHAGAHQRLQISCKDGKLVDVYIHLPAELVDDAGLDKLLQQAKPKFHNGCGRQFEVDAIGQ